MSKRSPSGYKWRNVRLELAATPEFPRGSASRAYMLHLPVREDGTIDEPGFHANPVIAAFRRFWPNEPDRRGLVVRTGEGWELSFQAEAGGKAGSFPIAMNRLLPGDQVTIAKKTGGIWRFRVVDLPSDGL